MIDASDVAHDSTSGAAASTIHTAFPLLAGGRNFTGIQQYDSHPTFTADEQIVDKKYVDDELTAGLAPKANIVDVMLLDGSQAMSGNMDLGGNIIAEGTPEKLAKARGSYTGDFLRTELHQKS